MSESKSGMFLFAGLVCFGSSFLAVGVVPLALSRDQPKTTLAELAGAGFTHEFIDLAERFPDQFQRYYPGGVTESSYAEALALGRDIYIAEACWHCHTQRVRPAPVSSDEKRWGPASRAVEYQNVLQRPATLGRRRVGPDLSREGARRSNDWHVAHFFQPTAVVPTSVMPAYPWFHDEEGYLNKSGIAIITYMQWLGSRLPGYPNHHGGGGPGPETKNGPSVGWRYSGA